VGWRSVSQEMCGPLDYHFYFQRLTGHKYDDGGGGGGPPRRDGNVPKRHVEKSDAGVSRS